MLPASLHVVEVALPDRTTRSRTLMTASLVVLDRPEDGHLRGLVITEAQRLQDAPFPVDQVEIADDAKARIDKLRTFTRSIARLVEGMANRKGIRALQGMSGMLVAAQKDWNDRLVGGFRDRAEWYSTSAPIGNACLFLTVLQAILHELKQLDQRGVEQEGLAAASPWPAICERCLVLFLVMTPEMILQRMRREDPTAACPTGLMRRSWERSELRTAIRYAPALSYPSTEDPVMLEWNNNRKDSIVGYARAAMTVALYHEPLVATVPDVHQLEREANAALTWLTSDVVAEWFSDPHSTVKKWFSTLVVHMHAEAKLVAHKNGCFLAVSYLMLWSPNLVEHWMILKTSHSPPFPFSSTQNRPAHEYPPEFERFLPGRHPFAAEASRYTIAAQELGLRGGVRYGKAQRRW